MGVAAVVMLQPEQQRVFYKPVAAETVFLLHSTAVRLKSKRTLLKTNPHPLHVSDVNILTSC